MRSRGIADAATTPGDTNLATIKLRLARPASRRSPRSAFHFSRSLSMRARPRRMPKTLRNSAGALLAVTAVAAVGCGSGDTKSTKDAGSTRPLPAPAGAPKDLKPVDFTVKSLADTVYSDTIILRGTAAHGATLEVDSAPV